jgi:glycosyltransferase involved in cell wall biosynthesis/SAM-dependent methyltransferase
MAFLEQSVRICLVSFTGYPDQGATYFFEMARSLAKLGHQVDAIAVQRPGEPSHTIDDNVRVVRIAVPLTTRWASPLRWAGKFVFLQRAARHVRQTGYDVVHLYSTIGAFLLPWLGGRRARWVHEIQTGAVSSRWRLARWVQDRLRAWQGRAFDANMAVTRVLGQRLFGMRACETVDEVPAGVNLGLFRPDLPRDFRDELGIPSNAMVFVHAGVLEAERGTEVPVKAFARALTKDERLWLLMPGRGRQLAALRNLARELGIGSRVWLPGYVPYDEIPRVYAASDAGLSYLPPVEYYEGQPPMKIMEYLGAGLPVIATDVSSHRSLVRHEENGLLAAPDEASYADAMLRLAGDPALREKLASRARSSVLHLSYDRIAKDRVLPVYRRLLDGDRYEQGGGRYQRERRWRFQTVRRALRPANRIPLDCWVQEQGRKLSGLILNVGAGEDGSSYGGRIVRLDAFAPRPTVRADLGCPLPFADAVFDGAICTEVLEHVPDAPLLLRELARVLKPGALAIVSIPFVFHYHPDPYDFLRLSPTGLRTALNRAGFSVEMMGGIGGKLIALALLIEAIHPLTKLLIRLVVAAGTPAFARTKVRDGRWSDWSANAVALARRKHHADC